MPTKASPVTMIQLVVTFKRKRKYGVHRCTGNLKGPVGPSRLAARAGCED
jgi:hypothetical protein